jgi:hypothetical protein
MVSIIYPQLAKGIKDHTMEKIKIAENQTKL